MRKFCKLSVVFIFISGFCYGQKVSYTPPEGPGFMLMELFTSEGCSSCPAADKAMMQLAEEYKHNFYTLEFHVDYWNYLGWKDRFSDAQYTKRQEQYGALFHCGSIYTPQVVINGTVQEVGSARAKIRPFLNQFVLKEPKDALSVSATAHMSKVFVSYYVTKAKGRILNIALVEKKAPTHVWRGENEGRRLMHTNVVRYFKTVDITEDHGFTEVELPMGIVAEECRVIAYTQKRDNWEVMSVAQCEVTPENH